MENNEMVTYRRIGGRGPIYAVHGTSSNAYADRLEETINRLKESAKPEHHRCHKRVNGLLSKLKHTHAKLDWIKELLWDKLDEPCPACGCDVSAKSIQKAVDGLA